MRDVASNLLTPITATLDASAQTVTFGTAIDKGKLFTIVNTTANVEIYTANDATNGGALNGGGTVLTLDYDTTSMNDADLLQVLYEGVSSDSLATEAKQDAGNTTLTDIKAGQVVVIGSLGGDIDTPSPAMPTGGVGVRGWLSAIWTKLNDTLAVTQSGTWTVQPGNTANTTAWKVDGSAVTQPVNDAGGSVTVDAPVGTPAFVRLSDGTNPIATLPVSNTGQDTLIGSLTETAPATDTDSSGLNGRLQRIAQRLTTLITNLGTLAFGSGTSTAALRVVLPTDQSSVQVRGSSSIATYMAATAVFTPAASAGDIFTIVGSGTKTVRLVRLILSGVQTTAGNLGYFAVAKRSTANSGGTPVAATVVPVDSGFAAGTATAQHYTANPTPGTTVGNLWNPRALVAAPATNGSGIIMDFNMQDVLNGSNVVLRGTSEALAISLGGTTPTGAGGFQVTVVWTEE